MDRIASLLEEHPEIIRIVIAARWELYFGKESMFNINGLILSSDIGAKAALASLGKMIKSLTNNKKQVFLILSSPNGETFELKKSILRSFCGVSKKFTTPITKEQYFNENGQLGIRNEMVRVARTNGAEVIDPMDYLCTNGVCISENEDGPIRYDGNHLRPGYVRDHVKYLDQTVAP